MRTLVCLLFLLFSTSASAQAPLVLTWTDTSSGMGQEDRFEIERKAGTGGYLMRGTTTSDVATFADDQVIVGLLYTFRVRACNSTGCSDYSNEASKVAEAGQPPAAPGTPTITWIEAATVAASINFQPTSAPIPPGYQKDDGSPYSATVGYGWDRDLSGSTRDRDANADQRLDTFAYVDAGTTATWRYDLPNGTYLVSLAAGDASWAQGPHRVTVEGVVVVNNVATAVNGYVILVDVPVTVTDGQLSIMLGGAGAGNTMLNYVTIK